MNANSAVSTALLLVVTSAAWVMPAAAQTGAATADLAGIVVDQSGARLPGAAVTAVNRETGTGRSAIADATGRYLITSLPPGAYDVVAELAGFLPQRREAVEMLLGTLALVDFTLPLADIQQQVTVNAEAPLVDPYRTAGTTVVDRRLIDGLPTNGRDFIAFSTITPGVTTDRTPQQGASATSGLIFVGQRARSNNITVDGLDNNDIAIGSVRATFSQEAVREFQVVAHSYSAEFGKAAGGLVNVVTRSGTNQFAGSGFLFSRDDALNAREHFERFSPAGAPINRPKAPFRQQQFGGSVGGPLVRNRSFLFASVERLDIRANNFVTIDDRTPVSLFGRPVGTAADILRRAGFAVETGHVPYSVRNTSFLAKVDHQIGAGQTLTVRYNSAEGLNENIEPWGGNVARSRGALRTVRDDMAAGSHAWVISSATVNELRGQFARRAQDVLSLDPRCAGVCDLEDEGGPTIEVLGVAAAGRHRFTPSPQHNDRYQIVNTTTRAAGSHLLKAGVDANLVRHRKQSLPLHFGGRYLFAALPAIPGVLPAPITSIQALALGLPALYIQGYGTSGRLYDYRDLSLFVQDDWRISSSVTLKLGVRYQRQFWPEASYRVPGYANAYSFPSDGNNIAPRLAATWDVGAAGRTVLRAATGVYFDNHISSMLGIADIVDGTPSGVRTLVARFPSSLAAWKAPGRRVPEAAAGTFPSLSIAIDPGLRTPSARHSSAGISREMAGGFSAHADLVVARGRNAVGTIDYNPVVPALGPGRRPHDVGGVAGSSASVLQYTSFGETWYTGATASLTRRSDAHQLLVSYTLSKAEDTSTDFQSAFIPQDNGRGRNASDPTGLPVGFNPRAEKGPSLQDQRHRVVLSGVSMLPGGLQVAGILTAASGRPFNALAGVDLNRDGDGGTIPGPDRPRSDPTDPSTAIGRNAGLLPAQATVDVRVARRWPLGGSRNIETMLEAFNLFNRSNFTDVNNIFGTGTYPSNPLATYGQFLQAGPPRQIQLAVRLSF